METVKELWAFRLARGRRDTCHCLAHLVTMKRHWRAISHKWEEGEAQSEQNCCLEYKTLSIRAMSSDMGFLRNAEHPLWRFEHWTTEHVHSAQRQTFHSPSLGLYVKTGAENLPGPPAPSLPALQAPLPVCVCRGEGAREGGGTSTRLQLHQTRHFIIRNIPREPTPKPRLASDKD